MRKTSTILLLAVMLCVSVCVCSSAPASPEPTSAVIDVEIEDRAAVTPMIPHIRNVDIPVINVTDVTETVEPTESVQEVLYYTEDDVIKVAKVLYRECRGIPSDTQKACVAWVVCNRVDSDEFPGDTIAEIVTARYQFAYYYDTPVTDELYELAKDVLTRWNAERNGEVSVGRVLPSDYTYFTGDGVHNYFRNAYKGNCSIWDYSLPSPYES